MFCDILDMNIFFQLKQMNIYKQFDELMITSFLIKICLFGERPFNSIGENILKQYEKISLKYLIFEWISMSNSVHFKIFGIYF